MKIKLLLNLALTLFFILICWPAYVYSGNLSGLEKTGSSSVIPHSNNKTAENNDSDNKNPSQPIIPRGVEIGTIYSTYRFNSFATDSDGDTLSYRFNWGDGTISQWGDVSQMHAWKASGIFKISVQARDVMGHLSPWSDLHKIIISNASSYMIKSQSGPNGHIFPSGDITIAQGRSQRFQIKPDPHYHISEVIVNGVNMGPITSYNFSKITENQSITASFSIKIHTIHAISQGEGKISPSGFVPVVSGSDQHISIVPFRHYRIKDVRVNGKSIGPVNSYAFSDIDRDQHIMAIFTSENKMPKASAGLDQIVASNTIVQLNGANSYDLDDGIHSYEWSQIKGSTTILSSNIAVQPTFTAPLVSKKGEALTFELLVKDKEGQKSSDTIDIYVTGNNIPPTIHPLEDMRASVGNLFTVKTFFMDNNETDIHSVHVNWGDDSSLESVMVSEDKSTATHLLSASHVYEDAGDYGVSLCVTDQNGALGCTNFTITASGEGTPIHIVHATFDEGQDQFEYLDNAFYKTKAKEYANGSWTGYEGINNSGALKIILGGNEVTPQKGMSGGFKRVFSIDQPAEVTLNFEYNLTQGPNYEGHEYSHLLVQVDGKLQGEDSDKHVAIIKGDGDGGNQKTTEWNNFSAHLGKLKAGIHTVITGAYSNSETDIGEKTTLILDNIIITGHFLDGGKPIGGFTGNDKIPQNAIIKSVNGEDLFTISFKIKDPANELCRLHDFKYSIDGGKTWHAPKSGDLSQSLELGWQTNSEQYYSSAPNFDKAETHFFIWNIGHPDNLLIDKSKNQDILIRFTINDGNSDSQNPLISEAIHMNNAPPEIHLTFDTPNLNRVPSGNLMIHATLSTKSVPPPQIFIERPLPMMSLGPLNMKGKGLTWNYSLPILKHNGTTVYDGPYKIIVFNVTDAFGNTTQKEGLFSTDTRDTDSDTIRDAEDSDDDGDGLPDKWEVKYGLDPLNGVSNYDEYLKGSNPSKLTSIPSALPRILLTIPHQGDGIINQRFVCSDSSVSILIEDDLGIDTTIPSNIVLTISDSKETYSINLSHKNVIRILKQRDETSHKLTRFWLVYDRINDEFGDFDYDHTMNIGIEITNKGNFKLKQETYQFHIESREDHNNAKTTPPYYIPVPKDDPFLDRRNGYNGGFYINHGPLTGAKILFAGHPTIVPTFKHSKDLPQLSTQKKQWTSAPLNIRPYTISNTPIKVLLPYPRDKNPDHLKIYYFDGANWKTTDEDMDHHENTTYQWIVPGSRRNHLYQTPPVIEIETYFHTAFQLVDSADTPNGTSKHFDQASCFISTLNSENRIKQPTKSNEYLNDINETF